MSQKGLAVIQSILSAIDSNDDQLMGNLLRLPLISLPKGNADYLLSSLLHRAKHNNNTKAARMIIQAFNQGRAVVDQLPTITNAFSSSCFDGDVLRFIISSFPEKEPVDFFMDLVNMRDDKEAVRIAGRLSAFFPNMSGEDWRVLLRLTDNVEDEEYGNQLLRSYFQSNLNAREIKKPSWIIELTPGLSIESVPDYFPTVEEAVDLILGDLQKRKIEAFSDEDASSGLREMLISQYSISMSLEKIQMLSPFRKLPKFDDTSLFQEFGPVNTIYTADPSLLDKGHECSRYGGCRMLLCSEFEEEDSPDWFYGSCDICLKKIAKRHYSLRQPLYQGGWRGCYCSFDCMKVRIDNNIEAVMAGRVKEQLGIIGIRERD